MGRQDQLDLLRQFLASKGRQFTTEEVCKATGYKPSSIKAHFSKKLHQYVAKSESGWTVRTALPPSRDEYLALMTQKVPAPRSPEENLADSLLVRAKDAFAVAVESYNRPSLTNRVEVFTILMANAWELLLKSESVCIDGYHSIQCKIDSTKTISLRDVVRKRIPSSKDPIRQNIESVADLRDKAVHILLPELQPHLSRLFQACVLNFVDRCRTSGQTDLFATGAGMLSLIIDEKATEIGVIRERFGDHTADAVQSFLSELTESEAALGSSAFAIPIEYRLVLTKGDKKGDILLTAGEGGREAIKLYQARDVADSHPHRPSDVVAIVRKEFPQLKFSIEKLNAIKKQHGTELRREFYYFLRRPPTHFYSGDFVTWLTNNLRCQPTFLADAWSHYKQSMKSKKPDSQSNS